MIGRTISHYKILEKLGEGGMGVVYKAQDFKLDRTVALKFLSNQFTANEPERKRFVREAKAASALDHPNICTFYELGETEQGQMFIAMAYYQGQTVKDKIKDRPLPIGEAIDIAIAIGQGLAKAHEKGITHRDIKSENTMLTSDGGIKIMDFGLASVVGASTLTKPGASLGTVPYMSPEQARGEKADHRSDIWSLGAVLYEMVTGQLPFKSQYNEAIVYSILNENPQPLTALRSGVPVELERVVGKCLEKKPGDRFQRADELIVDLRKIKGHLRQDAVAQKPSLLLRSKSFMYGGAGIVLALVVFLALPLLKEKEVAVHSIAVLPFKNISSDEEQEYFCEGMTEAIITDLAKLGQLVVLSPSAVAPYKGKEVDIRSIEQKLKVRYVVQGSVQRSGSALRVNAQLLNTENGVQMWANRFDRTIQDVFAVQDDISGKIVAALRLKLSAGEQQRIAGRPTQSLEAYDLYLRGRFYQNRRSVEATNLAIALLERATTIDPGFAAAFALLGSTYTQKSFFDEPLKKDWDEKSFVAVEKALSLDQNLAEAHVAKGNLLWTPANHFPHDKAIAAYRRAIELKPSYDEAHEFLGFIYYHIGLLEEGLNECRKALQLNPNSAFAQSRIGVVLLYLDRNEEALAELRKVPGDFNPQIIPMQIALALSCLDRRQEANEILDRVSKRIPEDPFLLSTQALMFAGEGKNDEALKKIDLAMKKEKTYLGHFHHAAYNLGSAFAVMKRNGDAVEWLRKSAEGGFPCYPQYERDSNLNNLRQDSAFRALLNDLKKQWESYKAML